MQVYIHVYVCVHIYIYTCMYVWRTKCDSDKCVGAAEDGDLSEDHSSVTKLRRDKTTSLTCLSRSHE